MQASSASARQASAGLQQQKRSLVQPAQEEAYIPRIEVNAVGAISVIGENDPARQAGHYRNIDGYREEDGRYAAFMQEISGFIPKQRQFTDPVRTFAYGTDASFYRLNPKLVVKVWMRQSTYRFFSLVGSRRPFRTFAAPRTRRLTVPVSMALTQRRAALWSFGTPVLPAG